jgi:hypothetical protein
MSERLCVFCKHLQYHTGGYGEYADPAMLECEKKHGIHGGDRIFGLTYERSVMGIDDFRAAIVHAKDCPDYAEAA